MLVAVIAEGVAIALLAVLVLGLLRSHALILRALHDLGAGLELEREVSGPGASVGPVHVELESGIVRAERRAGGSQVPDILGTELDGTPAVVRVAGAGERTLLAFLTTGCSVCATFWTGFAGTVDTPGAARLVIVAKDDDEESGSALRTLASPSMRVVRSGAAWAAYDVPGSPYFVLVEAGVVLGEGSATSWPQVRDLIGQALDDAVQEEGRGAQDSPYRIDAELRAAGIGPGHASLSEPPEPQP